MRKRMNLIHAGRKPDDGAACDAAARNLATLVLIDEVLMYAREKVGKDPVWQGRLADFFQALTQAATKLDKCALVASRLATYPRKSDELGKSITRTFTQSFAGKEKKA